MSSRIRENPKKIFECFCEVVVPSDTETKPWILQKYPEDFDNEEMLKSVPEFACPCKFTNDAVQHFSFVFTSLDSKWTYGFCRHAPKSPTLFVLLSFLPWHETFFRILNQISDLTNDLQSGLLLKFLASLYSCPVPEPGSNVCFTYGPKEFQTLSVDHLKLPSIPENRNLTEYFNAVDARNMMIIFVSMLHERRIVVTSKKLSRLSACVQAANSLIYPMHWQHIFIPVLPKHLLDYISAPMPFLIGIPASTMFDVKLSELGEAVILDADNNKVQTPFKDYETLPFDVVSSLKRQLKNPNMMLGDGVSRAFMTALVHLIGGYRDALKVNLGEKITFDEEAFIRTRPSNIQPFLEKMLTLQIFHQFIDDRLDMLNSGIGFSDDFELEVNTFDVNSNTKLKSQYKEWVSTMKKEGGTFLKNVKSKTNPAVKSAYKSVKDKSRKVYKDMQSKIREIQRNSSQPDLVSQWSNDKPKSAPSSPIMSRNTTASEYSSHYSYLTDNKTKNVDGMNLANSMSITGIRKYKMLTVDEISAGSDDSDHEVNPDIQPISMDLMGDLQDIIFRRCSTSSDGGQNAENAVTSLASEIQKVPDPFDSSPLGFEDAFCNCTDNDVFLPAPIPPPRTKRKVEGSSKNNELSVSKETSVFDHEPLIGLDSLDDSYFDPLKYKESSSVNHLPVQTGDPAVNELKEKIQNIQSHPKVLFGARPYFPPAENFIPEINTGFLTHPYSGATLIPRTHYHSVQFPIPGTRNVDQPPPLPPKTFSPISSSQLSKNDKDLLDDYGLGSSPIFERLSPGNRVINHNEKLGDLSNGASKQSSHSAWQKFS